MAARSQPRLLSTAGKRCTRTPWAASKRRGYSTTTSSRGPPTISDAEIAQLASVPLRPLSLSDLVRHGRPPLSTPSLLSSARFTLSLLPARLAHRLHAIQSLPYVVVSNPHISQIHHTYLHSLNTLLPFYRAGIQTLEEEADFTGALADLVQTHANTIPTLARGLKECGRYLDLKGYGRRDGDGRQDQGGQGRGGVGAKFLDEHLRARIGTRLVAEQHLALHLESNPAPGQQQQQEDQQQNQAPPSNFVGVIDTALSPVSVLRQCESFVGELCELRYGVRPTLALDGALDARIAHVPTHLEYVLTELLKNAFRAAIENGKERDPVQVTVALGCCGPAAFTDAGSGEDGTPRRRDVGTAGAGEEPGRQAEPAASLTIRIRDHGGGIAPAILSKIWDYSFSTFDEDKDGGGGLAAISNAGADGGGSIAGLGYGLPLGRAYAEHFGGELHVESLWGWGTDVYLRLKGLDTGVP